MILTPLRIVAWFSGVLLIGVPLGALVLFFLAITGSPGSCRSNNRPITSSPEAAAAFQLKWDQLDATLGAGQVSTIVFDESEATSRARLWLAGHGDVPVSDVYVCFSADRGSASGKLDLPFVPGDVDVLVRGRLDLTGTKPKVKIEEIKAGRLPGPLTGLVKSVVSQLIDDQTKDVTLKHDYGIAFGDGQATVSGQP